MPAKSDPIRSRVKSCDQVFSITLGSSDVNLVHSLSANSIRKTSNKLSKPKINPNLFKLIKPECFTLLHDSVRLSVGFIRGQLLCSDWLVNI